MIDLSIVIVNYKTEELTRKCVESIKNYTKGIKYETIVIDTSKNNLGYAGGNNAGIKKAKGKYILLLNSDTNIHDNVLGEMFFWMNRNPKIGIASCKLKNTDGSDQTTGGYFPTLARVFFWMILQDFPLMEGLINQFHPKKNKPEIYDLDWVGGAFFMIKREIVEKIGLIDEEYFMYVEETDFSYRTKEAGYRVVYNPTWSITHIGGASSQGSEFSLLSEFKNIKLFYKKHYPSWQFPILRLLLKVGALGRILIFGILRGKEAAKIYAKAFWQA